MPLLDPGPGEIWDRLTILSLKITQKGLDGTPVDHWERERKSLMPLVRMWQVHDGTPEGQFRFEQLLELGAVNGALWQKEDELRFLRDHPSITHQSITADLARVGVAIQRLNDRRAYLVSILNTNAGVVRGSEK